MKLKFSSKIELSKRDKEKGLVLPDEMSEDLAYLCGVLAGDGNINVRKERYDFAIKCVGNPKDEIEFYDYVIKEKFRKVFGAGIRPKLHDKGTTYGFSYWSTSLVRFLTEEIGLPVGRKYDKLKIPSVFKSDKKLSAAFIRGLADTDFCLTFKKNHGSNPYYPVIVGVSKSEPFMREIMNNLKDLGFSVCFENRRDFDKRLNKTILTYRIYLNGEKQLALWMSEIGFEHPKNLKKLNSRIKIK
jgi:hypothetical protein